MGRNENSAVPHLQYPLGPIARASARVSLASSAKGRPDRGELDATVRAIGLRIEAERETLARRVVERIRAEEEDAGPLADAVLADHAWLELIDDFVASLDAPEPPAEPLSPPQIERIREIAARRVKQRVPLESFLRRPRIWGEVLWEAVVASTRTRERRELEAALIISSRLMRLVDLSSRVITNAYLDEVTDRGLLRRDLLDALVSGKGKEEGVARLARSLHLKLADGYIVVVVRGDDMHGELGRGEALPHRAELDRIIETARRQVHPAEGVLLAGMHRGDLVVLYPVAGPDDLQTVRDDCLELAKALAVDVSLGLSSYHPSLSAVATAYSEARDAVDVADRLGIRGRAVGLDDVLVDQMLRASGNAQSLLLDAMQALVDYDQRHGSDLVATLQTYVETRFNLTKSGGLLFVHPNTVVYRLRRIHELTGRDPHDVDDLLVLWLGLKTLDLRAQQAP
jgi:sugar diacid utilization regulator